MARLDASVSRTKRSLKFGEARIGALFIATFSASKDYWASMDQLKLSLQRRKVIRDDAMVAYPLINLW